MIKLEIYPETHCDECGEIVHNHIDCPICEAEYAATDQYDTLSNMKVGESLICHECGVEFGLVEGTGYDGLWIPIVP